jgi:hypothetical protein
VNWDSCGQLGEVEPSRRRRDAPVRDGRAGASPPRIVARDLPSARSRAEQPEPGIARNVTRPGGPAGSPSLVGSASTTRGYLRMRPRHHEQERDRDWRGTQLHMESQSREPESCELR